MTCLNFEYCKIMFGEPITVTKLPNAIEIGDDHRITEIVLFEKRGGILLIEVNKGKYKFATFFEEMTDSVKQKLLNESQKLIADKLGKL